MDEALTANSPKLLFVAAVRSVFTTEASDAIDANSRASSTIKLPQLQVQKQWDVFFSRVVWLWRHHNVILCDVMLIWMLIFLYYYLQTCLWSNKVGSLPHKSRWGIKIQSNYFWVRMYDVYHIASKTDATITDTCDIRDPNSRFAAGHSRGTKSPCCRVRDALSQDKKKRYII